MAAKDNNVNSPEGGGNSKTNYALYAIVTVGLLYLIVRVVLHFKAGE